jgi:diguanylate cyclase (GGDEF)-like protein/PAS domain S-box-containing protein
MNAAFQNHETIAGLPIGTSELRYRRLFEAAQDGILILDAGTGAITDVNPLLVNLLGLAREEFLNKRLWEVGAFRDIKACQDAFLALQKDEYIRYKDLPLRGIGGRLIPVEFVSNVYWEGENKVIQCNIRDLTERKQALNAPLGSTSLLSEQSVRDDLTGLFNRRYMEETLERELLRASRRNLSIGIIMLDVDDFERFNDTHGRRAGDALLFHLGGLLQSQVRGEDTPSRSGGDDFTIILSDASQKVTRKRAEWISKLVRHTHFAGQPLENITFSLGVAVFPQDGSTGATVLQAAEHALRRAKYEGRSRVVAANGKSPPGVVPREYLE